MDTRSAWRRSWQWASDWFPTLSFWLYTAACAIVGALIALRVTGDWDAAGVWAVIAAPAGLLVAYAARLTSLPFRDIREARVALAQPSVDDATVEKRRRFDAYLDKQLEHLRNQAGAIESAGSQFNARIRWREFMRISWQATTGLSLLDDRVGEYLTPTLTEAERDAGDQTIKHVAVRLSARVIDAFEDCRHLYST